MDDNKQASKRVEAPFSDEQIKRLQHAVAEGFNLGLNTAAEVLDELLSRRATVERQEAEIGQLNDLLTFWKVDAFSHYCIGCGTSHHQPCFHCACCGKPMAWKKSEPRLSYSELRAEVSRLTERCAELEKECSYCDSHELSVCTECFMKPTKRVKSRDKFIEELIIQRDTSATAMKSAILEKAREMAKEYDTTFDHDDSSYSQGKLDAADIIIAEIQRMDCESKPLAAERERCTEILERLALEQDARGLYDVATHYRNAVRVIDGEK